MSTARVLKMQRNAYKLNADKEMKKMKGLLDLGANADISELQISCEKLVRYQQTLNDLNDKIAAAVVEDEECLAEVNQSVEYDERLADVIVKARKALRANEVSHSEVVASASMVDDATRPQVKTAVTFPKMPKLEIAPFDGDTLKWEEFWDSYKTTFHDRVDMSKVDKLKYLRSYLRGEALSLAEAYRVTDANYTAVIDTLKDWYDNKHAIIFAHLEAMLTLQPASGDVHQMRQVFSECEVHIRSLVALGLPEETFSLIFVPIMLSKVPKFMRVQMYLKNGSQDWTLANLRQYLKEQIQARHWGERSLGEDDKRLLPKKSPEKRPSSGFPRSTSVPGLLATEQPKASPRPRKCMYCGQTGHYSDECQKFATVDSRKAQLKGKCFICLQPVHHGKACYWKARGPCFHCKAKNAHHRSLCPVKFSLGSRRPESVAGLNVDAEEFIPSNVMVSFTKDGVSKPKRGMPVMQTALSMAIGCKGELPVRIALDTASTRSFCRTSILKSIGAKEVDREYLGIAGIEAETRKRGIYSRYEIHLRLADGSITPILVTSLKSVSCPLNKQAISPSDFPILSQLALADPVIDQPSEVTVDIILGLDYYYSIVGTEQIRLGRGIVLLGTKLGYVACGILTPTGELDVGKSGNDEYVLFASTQVSDLALDRNLEKLWRLEDVGVKDHHMEDDDIIAERTFNDTVQYDDKELRYSVKWPWKDAHPNLPDNYGLAMGRLKSLVSRTDAATLRLYDETIKDQVVNGIVEVAPIKADGVLVHHLPHHCVIQKDRATTKLRIVYDASSRVRTSDLSLNQCLYRGPVMLSDLCGLLLRFRMHKVAVISDIEKAFLMVGLQRSERDVTRFLWVRDVQQPIEAGNLVVYRFRRVLFGVISSQFLLASSIRYHLNKLMTPVAAEILRNIYVDNVICGRESKDEAIQFYSEAKSVFKSASMNLRAWVSNDKGFLESIPVSDRHGGNSAKVLGLKWNISDDTLSCLVGGSRNLCTTKREMLRALARCFDPCGFMSPVTVTGRIIMQSLWVSNVGWDDAVSKSLQAEWDLFYENLMQLPKLRIPRLATADAVGDVEIHCFCDASEHAYCAAAYLRTSSTSTPSSCLLFSKTRVSPIKDQKLTIPRLELMAACLGCKLVRYVQAQLSSSGRLYLWSDSTCTISWMQNQPQRPVFVRNRVGQGRKIIDELGIVIRYVPSESNPADLATRGLDYETFSSSELWWSGPSWLVHSEEEWPKTVSTGQSLADPQPVQSDQALMNTAITHVPTSVSYSKFSSFTKVVRVTAWILRFVGACRGIKPTSNSLQVAEMDASKRCVIKAVQSEMVDDVRMQRSNVVLQLGLYVDTYGIIRCSGKLDNSNLPACTRFPIFLPKGNHVVRLLIKGIHCDLAHAGVSHVLSKLRETYWLVQARPQIKSVISECRICRRWKGGPFKTPTPPPLSKIRLERGSPFSCSGMDYLGPLSIKVPGAELQKVWICLFTCAVTRALHLEVVPDMTAYNLVLSLTRFFAARGAPTLIVCDNAANFHAAKYALDTEVRTAASSKSVQDCCTARMVEWKFVVEMAPWMGGFYERMVGLVKKALRCAINNRVLTLIELQTVCTEITDILNSRPLTYSEDEVGFRPLTPNDLLAKESAHLPPLEAGNTEDPDAVHESTTTRAKLLLMWRRLRCRADVF